MMARIRSRRTGILAAGLAFLAGAATGQTGSYTVGVNGSGWRELSTRWVALDDTAEPGAIQPKELRPWENVMAGAEPETNIFGFQWHARKDGLQALGRELGLNPRVWGSAEALQILDGDATTALQVLKVVPRDEYNLHSSLTGSAYSAGFRLDYAEAWTFDLGFALPIERILFFPPDSGIDADGVPIRRRVPQGFELSVTNQAHDFLLLGGETVNPQNPYGPLDQLILRTLLNSERVVDLSFELQQVRFVRLNVGLMRQVYTLAEFQAFGRGVPQTAQYVSGAIDMGEPVNFGRVKYDLRRLRRTEADELIEDPEAPVSLLLQTRTGRDDTPREYWVIDELGRDRPATLEEYERADLPKTCCVDLRLPGMRSAVTEDLAQWTPWSSPYEETGLHNRSGDGRRWLQFRFDLRTADPLAYGRLRSLTFEFSPLLATGVVGEVALASAPGLEVISVGAGEVLRYTLDLRAEFDAGRGGFDAVRLGLPPGAAFVGLQMATGDGSFEPVAHDSLKETPGEQTVYFPSRRVDADDNRLVRLVFDSAVYNSTTVFTAEVIDTESDDFPQTVDEGNANDDVASNALQVFSDEGTLPILSGLRLTPAVLTPNGDGVNDVVRVAFRLMMIEGGRVRLEILDLSGRKVAEVQGGVLGRGDHTIPWNGHDLSQRKVGPGIYVARLVVDTERHGGERLIPIPVAY